MLRPVVFLVAYLLVFAPAYGHEPSSPGEMLSPQEVQSEFTKMATVKALQAVQTTLLVFFAATNGIALGDAVISLAREKYHESFLELREKGTSQSSNVTRQSPCRRNL